MSVSALAERLVSKGHEVIVFTTNAGLDDNATVPLDRPVDVNGVQVWYFRRKELLQYYFPSATYMTDSIGFMYALP